jgi:hypothetical protein
MRVKSKFNIAKLRIFKDKVCCIEFNNETILLLNFKEYLTKLINAVMILE